MKKILVRGHMSPFDNLDAATVLHNDLLGTNAGNQIFLNSVIRTLMTEDTQIDTFNTERDLNEENLEWINSEYDCMVLPFANAFRPTYQRDLEKITQFVKKLKIPCVVVGIGTSAGLKGGIKSSYPFDDAVKGFVKAILDKSAVIGTRGQVTSDYLTRLGFKEGSEHRVIGCPSMFYYGEDLPRIEKVELTPDSKVSINWKMDIPKEIHWFMRANYPSFKNLCYVPQVTDEIRLMYYGIPFPEGKYVIPRQYPGRADHPWYCAGSGRAFINLPSWIEYMKERDFSFGTRIHGNIAALMAGTPAYIIVPDYRISELAKYHEIPHIEYKALQEGDTIFSLYEKADYTGFNNGHRARFRNYVDFLEENGLDHVFKGGTSGTTPYDRKMSKITLQPALKPFVAVSSKEQAQRLRELQQRYLELREKYMELKPLERYLPFHQGAKGIKNFFMRGNRKN